MAERGAKPIVVFISSPGDLANERSRLDEVVRDAAARFGRYELHLMSWRWDRDAVPGVAESAQGAVDRQIPPEYDIYVGMMCRRFGTPTPGAGSGTLDEFQTARRRFERTASPTIVFYFCAGARKPGRSLQSRKVVEFMRCYPGLFQTFDNADHLAYQFQAFLQDYCMKRLFPQPGLLQPVVSLGPWLSRFASHLDAAAASGPDFYFDYSSGRPPGCTTC